MKHKYDYESWMYTWSPALAEYRIRKMSTFWRSVTLSLRKYSTIALLTGFFVFDIALLWYATGMMLAAHPFNSPQFCGIPPCYHPHYAK